MTLDQLLVPKREQIQRLAAKHGARNVRVFGSAARGEDRPDSDIDFLVDVEARTSSWFPAGLILELQQLLGRRIEIVTTRALRPELRERVLLEARAL